MEKICSGDIISSLFVLGFESVDATLFTYTLAQLTSNKIFRREFEYIDAELSPVFTKYVDYDGATFRLKEGYKMDTLLSVEDNNGTYVAPLRRKINVNKKLTGIIANLDFGEILSKKSDDCQTSRQFCQLEKTLMKSLKPVISTPYSKKKSNNKEELVAYRKR